MNLREARETRQKTLKQVADAVQTDVGNLSRIESGQIPKRDLMQRLIDYYDGAIDVASFYEAAPPIATAAEQGRLGAA